MAGVVLDVFCFVFVCVVCLCLPKYYECKFMTRRQPVKPPVKVGRVSVHAAGWFRQRVSTGFYQLVLVSTGFHQLVFVYHDGERGETEGRVETTSVF
jgi:hypothetical protein